MKAVILAGGLGTRLSESTDRIPKPLVEVAGKPLLLHIMEHFAKFNVREFLILAGYKGYLIKDYFLNFRLHTCDIKVEISSGAVEFFSTNESAPDWVVSVVDTGQRTMTGGRLRRVRELLAGEDSFFLTYGDGLSDVDLVEVVGTHRRQESVATLTGVRPPGRFGSIRTNGSLVSDFTEKPVGGGDLINGGFFVCSQAIFDYLDDDSTVLEEEPLQRLAREGLLGVHLHEGFWHCVDTPRDLLAIEELLAKKDHEHAQRG